MTECPSESELEPVGLRVLGEVDPRELSPEAFEQAPDLLFHGTPLAMEFSPAFDYRSESYQRGTDGSATLGFGFYTIDQRTEASNYSVVRQNRVDAAPIVASILPYRARILDLRRKNDLAENAPFPRELALKWREKFLDYLRTKMPRPGRIGEIHDGYEKDYAQYLDRVLATDQFNLRVLLQTAPSPALKSRNFVAPPWALLFSDFMLEQGYDGVAYNEGGEGQGSKGGTSTVFYNLKKIGTYKSWNMGGDRL